MLHPKTVAFALASFLLVAALAAPASAAPSADGPDSPSLAALAFSWLAEQIGWAAPGDDGDAPVVREKGAGVHDPNGFETAGEPGTPRTLTTSDDEVPPANTEGGVVGDPHG